MGFILFCLCSVLYSKLSTSEAMFFQYSPGSLTIAWNFTFSLFMKSFDHGILYCADYERNKLGLVVNPDVGHGKVISVIYNNERKEIGLKSLCGCDLCNEMMMHFTLESYNRSITIKCNNRGRQTFPKVNNLDRNTNHIPDSIKVVTEVKNQICVMILISIIGCMDSFYHDGTPLSFSVIGTNFKDRCLRNCSFSTCNAGKCRALYADGPNCDCSMTALNGRFCNNEMQNYSEESNNSYGRKYEDNDVHFKLSWKVFTEKKYCLLEFNYEGGHETLWFNKRYLWIGNENISEINPNVTNFISVTLKENNLKIKVNGKIVNRNAPFGKTLINIGFAEKNKQCSIFEGKYDFDYRINQLMFRKPPIAITSMKPISITNVSNLRNSPTKLRPLTFLNTTITITNTGKPFIDKFIRPMIILTILFSVILAIICTMKYNQVQSSQTNGNSDPKENGNTNEYIMEETYDLVDPKGMYSEKYRAQYRVSYNEDSVDATLPRLPPRD